MTNENLFITNSETLKTLRNLCKDLNLKDKIMVEIGNYKEETAITFAENVKTLYVVEPNETNTTDNFTNESIDFVYIDALHTNKEMTRQITAWLPKIKPDGVIGGRSRGLDYMDVNKAVAETLGIPDKIYPGDNGFWLKYKNPMPLHFTLTGDSFGYLYYVAVLTAIRTQKITSITIWSVKDVKSAYLDILINKYGVRFERIDIPPLPALIDKEADFIKSHIKDYIAYYVLYHNGGVFLDLDTISIKDITGLLGDKELVVPTDAENPGDFTYHYNGAILVAKKESPLLLEALNTSTERFNKKEDFNWGWTGPILISEIVFNNKDRVFLPEFGVCGGYTGWSVVNFYKEDESITLDEKTRVVHLFAQAANKQGNLYNNVTFNSVATGKSLLARTIKSILTEDEWNPFQRPYTPGEKKKCI